MVGSWVVATLRVWAIRRRNKRAAREQRQFELDNEKY